MTRFKNLLNIETDSVTSSKGPDQRMMNICKKFHNRVVAENRKSKTNYFHSYFTKHHGNIKSLWSGIKSIVCPKKSGLYHVSSLKDSQGNDTNDP